MTKESFLTWAISHNLPIKPCPKYTYVYGKKADGKFKGRYRVSNVAIRKEVKTGVGWVGLWTKYLKELEINSNGKLSVVKQEKLELENSI